MGRRRFGRVRQLPSKQWQARYPGPDGVLRPAPQTFSRRSDADRWLAAVEADLNRGLWADPMAGKLTVKEWSDRWLAAASGHLKIKTHDGYQSLLTTKVEPRFGHLALDAVKPIMVNEWVSDLGRRGQELRSPRPADRTRRGRRDCERGGRVRLEPVRTRSTLPVAERRTG